MPEFITDASRLNQIAESLLQEDLVAVDTESNGFFRYPERICLVQLAAGDNCYLIDPLAVDAAEPLGRVFEGSKVKKVLHSAENDIRALDREWGLRVVNVYDTSIGAKFLGAEKLGLGNIAEQFLGLKLEKNKKLQRADWSLRPLSQASLEYAAADVIHLARLMGALVHGADFLGRTGWVEEECRRIEHVRYIPPEHPERAFLSVKGSSSLGGQGLAILRELVVFRESMARRQDRPPFRVMSDTALVAIAERPNLDLARAPGLGAYAVRRYGRGLGNAVQRGLQTPPVDRRSFRKPGPPRPTPEQTENFKGLRSWRNAQGERLSLDPSLIWPADSLGRLARDPLSLEEELNSPEVRRWQVAEFDDSLRRCLLGLNTQQ